MKIKTSSKRAWKDRVKEGDLVRIQSHQGSMIGVPFGTVGMVVERQSEQRGYPLEGMAADQQVRPLNLVSVLVGDRVVNSFYPHELERVI